MNIKVERNVPDFAPVTVSFTITDSKLYEALCELYKQSGYGQWYMSQTLHENTSEQQNIADLFIDKLFASIYESTQ
jgi:hypothetical protein